MKKLIPKSSPGAYWGYVDEDGNWIIMPQSLRAEPFKDGFAVVYLNGKDGLINQPLKVVRVGPSRNDIV